MKGKLHEDLIRLPAAFFVHPWENADMESKGKFRIKYLEAKSSEREVSLDDAYGNIGPISKEFGNSKIKMLVKLTKSISEDGYLRGNRLGEDITATTLVDGSDYKYLIIDGTHRLSVLSALDYKSAPIRVYSNAIPAFIFRNEVDFWSNVKSGLYTRDQALKIFDSIFKADGNFLKSISSFEFTLKRAAHNRCPFSPSLSDHRNKYIMKKGHKRIVLRLHPTGLHLCLWSYFSKVFYDPRWQNFSKCLF